MVYRTLSEGLSEQYEKRISPDYCHRLMKKFFMPQIDTGIIDKHGAPVMVEMSTTELCRSGDGGFMDYVERIQEFAAHKGIYIPDPNEDFDQ